MCGRGRFRSEREATIDAPLLIASGIAAGYGGAPDPVIADVDLSVAAGELLTIVGRSASGKSTLLLCLSGLHTPSRGSIQIDGSAVTRGDPRTGLVLQHYGLFPWFTVEENVAIGLRIRRKPGMTGRHVDVREILLRFGLTEVAGRYPDDLSGGERQRVALARTLVLEPGVILLDEPFSALDALTREDLQDQFLRLLAGRRMAAVMVTHSIDEAVYLGDRVGILVDGDGPSSFEMHDNPAPPARAVETQSDRRMSSEYASACAHFRRVFREAHDA